MGPPIPGRILLTSSSADLGTSAMMYLLFSAAITLRMELRTPSISAFLEDMAASDVMTAAWDSTIVPTSTSLFILSVEPVETRSTM